MVGRGERSITGNSLTRLTIFKNKIPLLGYEFFFAEFSIAYTRVTIVRNICSILTAEKGEEGTGSGC